MNRAFFEEKYAQIFCALNIPKEALGVRLQKINNTEVREIISSKKIKYVEALEYFYEISFEFHYLEMLEVMEYLSDENIQYLCLFLIKNENLKYLEDKNIKERMLNLLNKCSMNSYLIAAVKQYYYITLTEREQKSIDKKFDELSNERWIDLFGITREYDVAAFLAFVKNHVCTNDKYSRDTRSLYQKLYINYINALRGEISYVKILTSNNEIIRELYIYAQNSIHSSYVCPIHGVQGGREELNFL